MKCMYKHNVWWIDQIIRIVAGLALIWFACYSKNYWFLIGLIPLLTWIFWFCPFYPLLKISTAKKEAKK